MNMLNSSRPRLAVETDPGGEETARTALVVVDNRALKLAVWRELEQARRRLAKAARDLHRHENQDVPAFRRWLGETFPQLANEVRDLGNEVTRKARLVQQVWEESYVTGHAPKRVWRRVNDPAPEPEEEATDAEFDFGDSGEAATEWDEESAADREARAERRAMAPEREDARACYRRMASRLHPDRGGEWTTARERLWHEVQAAWEQGDADRLARLEAEWEMASDTLGPESAVGRLRAALVELGAARRDVERTLRVCRKDPAWRHSVVKVTPTKRREVQGALQADRYRLRMLLGQLDAQIAQWERPGRKDRHRAKRGER